MRSRVRWTIGRVLLLTTILGFSVLLFGGYTIYASKAPIPGTVRADSGAVVFTGADIMAGQAIYQEHGLMDWGSVLGHGTYFGPDFTAEMLHARVGLLREALAREGEGARSYADAAQERRDAIDAAVKRIIKTNRYAADRDELAIGDADAAAFATLRAEVKERFTHGEDARGLQRDVLSNSAAASSVDEAAHRLTAFFWWTSWLAGATRHGDDKTYTNNWPFDPDAGNVSSTSAMLWSAVSVGLLLLFLPLVILAYVRGKYRMEDAYPEGAFPKQELSWLPVYPSQRKTLKYFVTAGALFLLQAMLGGYLAHGYVEGNSFYGIDLSTVLPFNVAKTWHLQLAVFWIATCWLGLGIYVAPLIGGREPKHQGLLVDVLWGALVVVALGSLAGEWMGVRGMLGKAWWLLGHSGWEIIELGMIWKALLAVGFGLWLFIVVRAVKDALRADHERKDLVRLFVISAVSIPAMFAASFLITPGTHLTMADYWRWWIIHLWVEGMFEVFTVVVAAILFVNMGLVTRLSAARAVKFQLVILLGSGLIGTGHHYYWIGADDFWISMGSVFSGLEVIPLTLLAVEAVDQWRTMKAAGADFPYKHTFAFLIAVAFWNMFGAGVLGFLINLPIVNYYEHGSFLTANHGHGALMGVFGMLALALALYCVRNVVTERGFATKLFRLSFWGLNVGLMGMIVLTLTPIGIMQLVESANHGFWSARTLEFYRDPAVHTLLWLRILPDMVFIGLGVVPMLAGLAWSLRHMRPATPIEEPVRRELRKLAPQLAETIHG